MKQFLASLLALVFAFVSHASAQKNELAGLIGRTFISDQGIQGSTGSDRNLHFGNGLTFEVNYARRLLSSDLLAVSVEVPLVVNPDEDLSAALPNPVPEQYASYFVTPAARLNLFSGQAVSPWVSVGGGFGHFAESSTLQFGLGKNPGKTGTTTGIFQIGAGLDVRLRGHFGLRGEFRDFWSGVPQLNVDTGKSRQHNFLVAGGVVWRF